MSKSKKIHTATILHEGWEMDNKMWVMEDENGSRTSLTTNHGCLCRMS